MFIPLFLFLVLCGFRNSDAHGAQGVTYMSELGQVRPSANGRAQTLSKGKVLTQFQPISTIWETGLVLTDSQIFQRDIPEIVI